MSSDDSGSVTHWIGALKDGDAGLYADDVMGFARESDRLAGCGHGGQAASSFFWAR